MHKELFPRTGRMVLGAAFACCLLLSLPRAQSAFPAASPSPSLEAGPFYDFLSGSLELDLSNDTLDPAIHKRMGRRETFLGLRHPHCSKSRESWSSTSSGLAEVTDTVKYRVTITTASTEPPWKVFPLWHLLMFMKRFYSCCKLGYPCKKIRGYQGRLIGHDERKMEFFLRPEYLNLNVLRAQLNLHIANPDRVMLEAEIRVKLRGITASKTTRNITWHKHDESELAFDTLFLFKMMKEAHFKEGGGTIEFSLILKCSQGNTALSCSEHGVSVLRAPFMAIGYI
ncbi:uncharacterized protein [Chiloscyllium punctatum]|uniref:uncharacterized protein n=1 Tax=Chiloscyllium punctatum TaxID=137246 RepID=UPI003B639E67